MQGTHRCVYAVRGKRVNKQAVLCCSLSIIPLGELQTERRDNT